LSPKWLATAQFAYHRENVSTLPGPGGDVIAFLDNTGANSIASGGFQGSDGTGQWDTKKFTRYDYRASGNWFAGDHDVKFGGEFGRVNANVFRTYSGGQFVTILSPYADDPQQRNVYFHSFFASPDSTIDNVTLAPVLATPNNDNLAFFVQDK